MAHVVALFPLLSATSPANTPPKTAPRSKVMETKAAPVDVMLTPAGKQ